MSLGPGARLGPYEILTALGAGGMGEVYKARDTRLNRSVAVKVLLPELASDPDRRSRFEREAHAIAALSHPHICTIFDIGRENGTDYLVMELLEGETLADRLGRAKAGPLPMPDVLRYGIEIADALDKAHRAGIVHRDLKPANIMITKSGAKLLDFGLAKLKGPAVPISMTAIDQATTTGPKTTTGSILGTVHYMAPEQVEGREADARSDVWALGVVIYEMTTGTRPFEGDSAASIIGSILKDVPAPISSRQRLVPRALDRLVAQCLDKDPETRWQSARDLMTALSWADQIAVPHAKSRGLLKWAALAGAALLVAATVAVAVVVRTFRPPPSANPMQFVVLPPEAGMFPGDGLAGSNQPSPQFAIAPDGRRLAFVATTGDGRPRVWMRSLDTVTARPLAGTEGAARPFWSPDGRYVGFFAGAKLKTILANGGPVQVLCDAANPRGGTWNRDGVILFAAGFGVGLSRVSANGGPPATLTQLDEAQQEISHRWPQFLPDGRHFLYLALNRTLGKAGIFVGSLDSKDTVRVLDTGFHTEFVMPGYLLFVREGSLLAQPFDPAALKVTGDAVPLADHVGSGQSTGEAPFSASPFGLAYAFSIVPPLTQLTWFDRAGRPQEVVGPPAQLENPVLSRDDRRVAFQRIDPLLGTDVWLMDASRSANPSRFTFDPAIDFAPIWAPDGRQIVFSSNRVGVFGIYQKPLSQGGETSILSTNSNGLFLTSWSSDGKSIVYAQAAGISFNTWVLPLGRDHKPAQILKSDANVTQGQLSDDGQLIAYTSDETGNPEVFVQPFVATGAKWQVSNAGGSDPHWRRDSRELFYVSLDGKLMAAQVRGGPSSFEVSGREALFQTRGPTARGPLLFTNYASAADGQRFLFNTVVGDIPPNPITVSLDWTAKLNK
jgi:Tol biopolymer transport system component